MMYDDKEREERRRKVHELVTRAAESGGVARDEIIELGTQAGWPPGRLETELESSGWLDRLRTDAEAKVGRLRREAEEKARSGFEACMASGPAALARMPEAELLALLPKRLRVLLDDPDIGKSGLLVIGDTSIGKSAFCVAAVRVLIQRACERHLADVLRRGDPHFMLSVAHVVAWCRAFDIVQARRQQPLGKGEAPLIERATDVNVLVLDDLGWGRGDSTVAEVLAVRYDRGKPTIATAGDTFERLNELLGESVVRRVLDPGGQLVDLFPNGGGR